MYNLRFVYTNYIPILSLTKLGYNLCKQNANYTLLNNYALLAINNYGQCISAYVTGTCKEYQSFGCFIHHKNWLCCHYFVGEIFAKSFKNLILKRMSILKHFSILKRCTYSVLVLYRWVEISASNVLNNMHHTLFLFFDVIHQSCFAS